MANLKVLDGDQSEKYLQSSGAGTDGDPHIPQHLETNSAAILTAVAAIQAAVEILDNVVSGSEAQVDVVASLPAGTNNVGKVVITGSSGNDLEFAKENDNWNAADNGIIIFARDTDTAPEKYRAIQTDANGHLKATLDTLPAGTNAIGKLAANSGVDIGDVDVTSVSIPSSVYNGQETVDAAGTAQAIGSSQALLSGVTVKALAGNAGLVYVGNSGVSSANGFELAAGEQVFIEAANVATVYVDAATNNDGVSWVGS